MELWQLREDIWDRTIREGQLDGSKESGQDTRDRTLMTGQSGGQSQQVGPIG